MKLQILGTGLWARAGLTGAAALKGLLADASAVLEEPFVNPKPEAIAAKERRRAGLLINLAVEVAHQACEHGAIDKRVPPSVFVSAMGDTAITDYMCRKLAAPEKLLSPTKFHNSVHNAPSGYWTISAENRAPSSFVGGFTQSFGAGLLEAASQALAQQQPVLLVAYDIANSAPFDDIAAVTESLGLALLLAPVGVDLAAARCGTPGMPARPLTLSFQALADSAPQAVDTAPTHAALRALAHANPVGGGLALLEALYSSTEQELAFAAAPGAVVNVTVAAGECA